MAPDGFAAANALATSAIRASCTATIHTSAGRIARAMAAKNAGLQRATVRNILPVCGFLGAALFAGRLNVVALLGMA
jgi:hypothetical protein